MLCVGLMSGTSLDGVDAALLETNGDRIVRFGPGLEMPYAGEERAVLQGAVDAALQWRFDGPPPEIFTHADQVLLDTHARAVEAIAAASSLRPDQFDLIGFHGQTVIHQPPLKDRPGRTVQLGSGEALARRLGAPVVFDFRSADMAAGGQGAPLAPIYHALLAEWSGLERPLGVLNLGGVANLTLIGSDQRLHAFDTGPGNGLIDAWVRQHAGAAFDANGVLASQGRIHDAGLAELLDHPHFALDGPKSLDRWDFSLDPVRNLTASDGAATLSQFTAEAVALGLDRMPERPQRLIVCGGGRKNADLMRRIAQTCGVPVAPAEAVGWRGDFIEAEAFAVLAARVARGLDLTWPATTGVERPLTGGRIARP